MGIEIGLLLFPKVTQLDLTGPLQFFSRLPDSAVRVVARGEGLVETDCGIAIAPNATFESCPKLDVLCVPGGYGVLDALQDEETARFVRRQASGARLITSVCTGAFLLGAAGLLRGRRATTHWAYRHLLPLVGAIPTEERIVRDGPVWTGGGVTAGIDFSLALIAEIAGEATAKRIGLALEYDPAPPFRGGSRRSAEEEVLAAVEASFEGRLAYFEGALRAALRS